MRRIENFLYDYSIAIKPVLVLVWVFWGLQVFSPLVSSIKEESIKKIDCQAEMEARKELCRLGEELVLKAEKEGASYSPKRYFEDLRRLREKERLYNALTSRTVVQLQQILRKNVKKNLYSYGEISEEAKAYRFWIEDSEIKAAQEEITLNGFLSWLAALYFRTIPLAILYYLTRMAQEKGILETILAGKRRLLTSVLLWPVFFGKYPFNVVREIRVEAELRRIKSMFRVLKPGELKIIRQIANSPDYRQLLAGYRKQNQKRFKRGLILALGGTIVFHILLLPSCSRASERRTEDSSPGVICEAEQDSETGSMPRNECRPQAFGIIPDSGFPEPPATDTLIAVEEKVCLCRRTEPIDHIPISLLFGRFVRETAIQTALKGRGHEQKSSRLVGCFVRCQ